MKSFTIKLIVLLSVALLTLGATAQDLPHKVDLNNQIIRYDGFIISYNEQYEQANWVYYVLKPSDFVGEETKRRNNFRVDKNIKSGTASLADYKGSGYDRGHLKPSGDEPCDSVQMSETFYMSNMSPQEPSFNRGVWKRLETYVRNTAMKSDSVIVITGGVLTDNLPTIGENEVAVPRFYYKVIRIYNDGKVETLCFLLKNEKSKEPLYTFRQELSVLENFVGIEF